MKHHLFTASLLGLGLLAATPRSQAQTPERKWGISGYASTLQYHGDLGENYWDARNLTYGGGLTLSRYITKGLDLNLSANQATLRYPADGSSFTGKGSLVTDGRRFYANVSSFGLGFKFKLNNGWALKETSVIQPYALIQPGFAYIYTDRYRFINNATTVSSTNYGAFDVQAALGLTFRVAPTLSVFVQAGQHVIFADDDRLDGVGAGTSDQFWNTNDRYMQFSAGLTANFGKPKDADGDGVPDRKDKCPDTPQGVKVDENGCPIDTDGDVVADYQDKCPETPGLAALQGCPDADGDGVADYLDKCPGTPAGVKVDAKGCPLDRDGDGVPDYQDRCPDRAASARAYMLSKGISAERIESRGYGETKPIADNKTA
ncbi:MAG: hypothetical protein EOO57_11915, partial [Hymenobacter sp.]